ncbi:MAG: twin-arginine translocase subunit TatC [Actinobacteria bacterium]|nr:twin-arginine translocase subunit TatC [Cyanobacteriota bacterium]MCL5771687.1 twin-arginine translocase subunit TatC [Actinomycetota bacterium]
MFNFFKKEKQKNLLESNNNSQNFQEKIPDKKNDNPINSIFNNDDSDSKQMSFIDHLDELRKRLLVVLIVFVVAMIAYYPFHNQILHFLTSGFIKADLVYLEIMEPFLVNLKIAFFCAIVTISPLLAYQIAVFIAPAFSRKIRKYMAIILILFFILFAAGFYFAYKFLVPISIKWLLNQGSTLKANLSVSKYINFVGWFMIGGGIAFETPLVLMFLIKAGIVQVSTLRRQWRVVYIVILLLSAIITPDWSPVTMAVLAIPMILLYELSMILAKIFK